MQVDAPPSGMDIRVQSVIPVFLVDDVNGTAEWYSRHLGFETTGVFPPEPPAVWASLERDGAEIMLQRLPGYRKPDVYARRPGGVWDAYIRMRGVHAFYKGLQRETFIKKPLTPQPYGDWEFEVVDLNGYVLVFSEGQSDARTA